MRRMAWMLLMVMVPAVLVACGSTTTASREEGSGFAQRTNEYVDGTVSKKAERGLDDEGFLRPDPDALGADW